MWIWNKLLKPAFDVFDRLSTVTAIATFIWPLLLTGGAIVSGVISHESVMWIVMAAALTFMGTTTGILMGSLYLERKNPQNKILTRSTIFTHDLGPVQDHNRHTRRGMKSTSLIVPNPPRRIIKGQLAIELINTASFPISVFIESAETSVEGQLPGRTKYPKAPVMQQPGAIFWVHDEPIEIDLPCGIVRGEMNLVIKYGHPGRERYTLIHKGNVEVFFEPNGFMRGLYFHPAN